MAAVVNIPTDREIEEQQALTMIPRMMSSSVVEVLHRRIHRLHQIRATIAGAYAMAEANEDSSSVRWALEFAIEQFVKVIDSLDTIAICRDADEEDREAAALQYAAGVARTQERLP